MSWESPEIITRAWKGSRSPMIRSFRVSAGACWWNMMQQAAKYRNPPESLLNRSRGWAWFSPSIRTSSILLNANWTRQCRNGVRRMLPWSSWTLTPARSWPWPSGRTLTRTSISSTPPKPGAISPSPTAMSPVPRLRSSPLGRLWTRTWSARMTVFIAPAILTWPIG